MARNETILLSLNQLTSWGILTTDADWVVTGWNEWLEINSGRRADEVIGRNLLAAFPEITDRRLDRFFRQALEGRVVVLSQRLHEYLLALPLSADETGFSHMQQSVRITPLVEEGRVVGTLTAIEDVTERVANDTAIAAHARQQAALALLGQRALAGEDVSLLMEETARAAADTLGTDYCAILERTPDGRRLLLRAGVGWRGDPVGQAEVDAGSLSHAGYTLGLAQPVIIAELSAETRFPVTPILKEHGVVSGLSVPVIGGGQPLGVVSVYTVAPRVFAENAVHFLQAAANVLGMAIERRRLEQELQARMDQLADADRRKDEFLAMLAHELRNPLAPIRNATEVLRLKEPTDPESRYARDVIGRQVQQMTRLVDDLLDVSRITRGKVVLQNEPLDLVSVVTGAVEISRPVIAARKHRLHTVLPPAPLPVEGDVARLAQVLANLLNNAAKFTEEGGRIDLIVERDADEAVIRVRDTGVGLPPEALSTIFDLFTQVQGSVSRSDGGLGIGLSLVRSLVEMHGGSVSAASEGPGRGSEFRVRLPLMQQPQVPRTAVGNKPTGRKVAPRDILIVDDNVDAAESLSTLLRLLGHTVATAHSSHAALEAAQNHTPDVVLLDIGLPGISGLEVARRLRGNLGLTDVLLIALTGYGQEEDRRRSQEAGFNAHLIKPVDLDALNALLTGGAPPPTA